MALKILRPVRQTAFYWIPPAFLFYMELIVKIACFGEATYRGLFYTALFSVSIGLFCALLGSLGTKRVNWIVIRILLGLLLLLGIAQIVYFQVFETFGTIYSLFIGAGAITEFWSGTLTGIYNSLPPILFLLLPYIAFLLFGKPLVPEKAERAEKAEKAGRWKPSKRTGALLAGVLGVHIFATALILNSTAGILSIRYLYQDAFIPSLSVSNFGVLTTARLDAKQLIYDKWAAYGVDQQEPPVVVEPEPAPPLVVEYGENITNIDFDALIETETDETLRDMHQYFNQVSPTKKNEYTGLFKGKNLIWIVGESFSSLALNDEITPTLSRMAKEGFVFHNFYNPIWGVSTSDGEYVTLTGLIPKSGVWSFRESSKNDMAYGFGNLLSPLGYTCKAYHNHYYQYYGRHLSHPNLGYEYKGLGNGLKVTETWPESDLEMMEITIPQDFSNKPFHTYYLTVSGHLNYTFVGNSMAAKHRDLVKDLPYSEGGKAYLACNVELDLALQHLLKQLELAGLSEDTVIVLSGDHYPYGLTDEEMDELAGHELDKTFEKYKSTLIIWSGSIKEPIEVNKVCSSLDIMPTLANLMGIEYDSRLVFGEDILSDAPGLVEFSDRSFLTDLGGYVSKADQFFPRDGVTVGENYARGILEQVNDSFAYSAKILEEDYYRRIFGE